MTNSKTDFEYFTFDFSDHELVEEAINLLNEGTATQKHNIEFWNWRFHQNPFGKSIGWFAKDKSNHKLAGILFWWPWKFKYQGQEILFYQAMNGKTSQQYRNSGVFRTLNELSLKYFQNEKTGLYGFPNENSYPSYHEPYWKTVTKVQPYLVPVSLKASVLNVFKSRKFDFQSDSNSGFLQMEMRTSGENNDDFLRTAWNNERIKWRFDDHPLHKYDAFIFENQNIIYRVKKRHRFTEAQIVCSDVSDNHIPDVFLKHLTSKGIDFMTYFGYNTNLSAMLEKQILKYKRKKNLYFVIHNSLETENFKIRFEMAETDSQ